MLIAPDSFGDTLTAVEAAAAIAAGWNRVRPRDHLIVAPQSDGGPGFVDVLARRCDVWIDDEQVIEKGRYKLDRLGLA